MCQCCCSQQHLGRQQVHRNCNMHSCGTCMAVPRRVAAGEERLQPATVMRRWLPLYTYRPPLAPCQHSRSLGPRRHGLLLGLPWRCCCWLRGGGWPRLHLLGPWRARLL
jgi:hypothetical protein